MHKEPPLWQRLYFDPAYAEICRAVGYRGCLYRELAGRLQPIEDQYGQQRVEAATMQLLTYEGQYSCTPRPLAHVELRTEVRKLCWQLLGPPPEYPFHAEYQAQKECFEKENPAPPTPDPEEEDEANQEEEPKPEPPKEEPPATPPAPPAGQEATPAKEEKPKKARKPKAAKDGQEKQKVTKRTRNG
jgi:hypothetical protein